MLNGRIYNFTLKKFKIKCLLILQKKIIIKCLLITIIIIIIHILKKKKSYYIILSCALHGLPISFSNFQGNSIRNLKKKLSVLKFVN